MAEIEKQEELRLTQRIEAYLDFTGKEKYISASGVVEKRTRLSFTTPKTLEAKEAFFKYLNDKGIFNDLVSVNSQTLNGFCKAEYDSLLQAGKETKIPGIEEPKEYVNIILRKGK